MTIRVVILAAGKGTRMKSELPKALIPFRGKPMVMAVVDAVRRSGIDVHPVVVVGHGADAVRAALGPTYTYVMQNEQRGTGHAVAVAESVLHENADAVLVLYIDNPFLKAETIRTIAKTHRRSNAIITIATATVPHFDPPYDAFAQFGRIVRDGQGKITAIVEASEAIPEMLQNTEVNGALYCFNAAWLWKHLALLQTNNAKGELFLTDCIALAVQEGAPIVTVPIRDAREIVGVNSMEQLHAVEQWQL